MVLNPLFLDSGNTRLKWNHANQYGVFGNEDELASYIRKQAVEQIVLASVTDNVTKSSLECISSNVRVDVVSVENGFLGLQLAYEDVSKLGVDRWLNMLAAYDSQARIINIVVSMGTAITIDVVDEGGNHLGGYIVPGLVTQALSLNQRGSALPMVGVATRTRLGTNTQDCISHGILKSACALVESSVSAQKSALTRLTVTGGDGLYLSESLSIKHEYSAGLLFKGMRAYWHARQKILGK
jgi:type III pantothenate kinase